MNKDIEIIDIVSEIEYARENYEMSKKEALACIYWVEYKNQTKAYELAGFKATNRNSMRMFASKLFSTPNIKSYCNELVNREYTLNKMKIEEIKHHTENIALHGRLERDRVEALKLLAKLYGADTTLYSSIQCLRSKGVFLEYNEEIGQWFVEDDFA